MVRPTAAAYGYTPYFDAVRRELLDIPWEQRQQLLSDLVGRLDSITASDPEMLLGSPKEYAFLARSEAGYSSVRPRRFAYLRAWRRRTKVLVVVIPLVTALVIGALVWRAHYQPLTASVYMSAPGKGVGRLPASPADRTEYFTYVPDATIAYGAMLENTGRASVTVTGLDTNPDSFTPLVPVEMRVQSERRCCLIEDARPVKTVTIDPGERVTLWLVFRMMKQELGRGNTIVVELPELRVEVLGLRHLVALPNAQAGLTMSGTAAG
jgi:hypothetical protein